MLLFLLINAEEARCRIDGGVLKDVIDIWEKDPHKLEEFVKEEKKIETVKEPVQAIALETVGEPVLGVVVEQDEKISEAVMEKVQKEPLPVQPVPQVDIPILALERHKRLDVELEEMAQFNKSGQSLDGFIAQEQKEIKKDIIMAIAKNAAEKTYQVVELGAKKLLDEFNRLSKEAQLADRRKPGFFERAKAKIKAAVPHMFSSENMALANARGEVLHMLLVLSELAAPQEFYPTSQADKIPPELTATAMTLLVNLFPEDINPGMASYGLSDVERMSKNIQENPLLMERIMTQAQGIQAFYICQMRYNPNRPDKFSADNLMYMLKAGQRKFAHEQTDSEKKGIEIAMMTGKALGSFVPIPLLNTAVGYVAGKGLAMIVYLAASQIGKKK